jgi:hypothetical protein
MVQVRVCAFKPHDPFCVLTIVTGRTSAGKVSVSCTGSAGCTGLSTRIEYKNSPPGAIVAKLWPLRSSGSLITRKPLGDGLGDALGDGLGDALGDGDALGEGLGDALGDGLGDALGDGDGLGDAHCGGG